MPGNSTHWVFISCLCCWGSKLRFPSNKVPWQHSVWECKESSFFCFFYTRYYLSGNLDRLTAAARTALPSPTSACKVSLCLRNPPNSDKVTWTTGYTTMRTSFLCVCIRMGTDESAQHFWLRKKSHKFFLCSWWGSNLGSLDLESDALPIDPPRHPPKTFF